jgi:uncharacterized protein (DUF2225 family)
MKSLLRFLLVAFCLISSAKAHTSFEKEFTCPIDGTKFKQFLDASGTRFGMRLDFKALGPIAAPWAVPFCPKCHFVLYEDKFDDVTLQKLKPFIESDKYRADSKGQSSYYCLALIRDFMGADAVDVGFMYLQASWQVEADAAKCTEYLKRSHEKLTAGFKSLKPEDERYINIALLCGELERRLGKFEEAKTRFTTLKSQEPFQTPNLKAIIDRQLTFIAKRDAAPHGANQESEKLMSED